MTLHVGDVFFIQAKIQTPAADNVRLERAVQHSRLGPYRMRMRPGKPALDVRVDGSCVDRTPWGSEPWLFGFIAGNACERGP